MLSLAGVVLFPNEAPVIEQEVTSSHKQHMPLLESKTELEEKANIYLNYDNASLASIVHDLAKRKNINYIPVSELDEIKISFSTRTPITLRSAWSILNTLLKIHDYAMINIDGMIKIVKTEESNQEPLPAYINKEPKDLPDSDKPIRYLYFFNNIKNEQVSDILQNLLGDGSSVQSIPELNACVISAPAVNIKQAMKVIQELDTGGLRESIQIIRLKHTSATEIEALLKDILNIEDEQNRTIRYLGKQKPERSSYFSKDTRIIADERNNTLILLGTKNNLDKIRHFINHPTKGLDLPLESPNSRLHIKELKYSDSEKMGRLIESMIQTPTDSKSPLTGTVKLFEDMVIAAETSQNRDDDSGSLSIGAGNRIIIACNDIDWIRIEKFIDKLDKPIPTVAMEILFVEASVESTKELQAQWRNRKAGIPGRNINMQTQHIAATPASFENETNLRTNMINPVSSSVLSGENASFFTLGCVDNIWAAVKVILQNNSFNVISQPFLVANHNQKTNLTIEDERRVAGELDPSAIQTVVRQEPITATTQIEVTPRINLNGEISLHILINLDEFQQSSTNAQPDKTKRTVSTRTTMHNGEVLVIGGLLSQRVIEELTKTPLLGDLPIIGNLFRGKQRTTTFRDLYIFIRPTLIKPQFEGKPDDYSQLKLDYARINLQRSELARTSNDPIQRWFFDKQDRKLPDEFEQIDDFIFAKHQPRTVNIIQDPYYKTRTSRTIQARRRAIIERRRKLLAEKKLKNRKRPTKSYD